MSRLLRPLIRAATYRRAVFLLLGAVLALPYLLGAGLLVQTVAETGGSEPGVLASLAVAVVIALIPPFLGGTRELEIAAARSLLEVDLPGPGRGHPPELETRLRGAVWFGLHLLNGVAIGAVVLIAIPLAMVALTGGDELGFGPSWWWIPAGPLLLLASIYAVAGLGRLAATMAPVLLGPSPAQRLAEVREQERRLAERNRLARELHDSVGHALTAMTLQAGAARSVFDRDPGFARQALSAIEETGRTAAGELDAVLGILRDEAAGVAPAPTLADVGRLLTGDVHAEVADVDVPPQVSREAFRIVQESLTNAARHGIGTATLRIHLSGATGAPAAIPAPPATPSPGGTPAPAPPPTPGATPAPALPPSPGATPAPAATRPPGSVPLPPGQEELVIEVTNRRRTGPRGRSGGHGIDGMRERVRLLGGALTAGPSGEMWHVEARLPITTVETR